MSAREKQLAPVLLAGTGRVRFGHRDDHKEAEFEIVCKVAQSLRRICYGWSRIRYLSETTCAKSGENVKNTYGRLFVSNAAGTW